MDLNNELLTDTGRDTCPFQSRLLVQRLSKWPGQMFRGLFIGLGSPRWRGGLCRIGVSNKRIMDILCWDAAVLAVSWVLSQCFSFLLLNLRRCSLKLSFQSLPLLPEILCRSSSVCAPLSCFVDSHSSVSRLCFNLLLPWTSVSQQRSRLPPVSISFSAPPNEFPSYCFSTNFC